MDVTDEIFYTYIYLDPRKMGSYKYGNYEFEAEPFYVGKGKGNRCNEHLFEAKHYIVLKWIGNKHKYYKIRNILKSGFEPIILKIEKELNEQAALDLEIWMIWAIGRSDLKLGPLTNHTDGGECPMYRKGLPPWNIGISATKKAKQDMSIAQKRRFASPEARKILSDQIKGKKHSVETKIKMSNSRKGHTVSEDTRKKISETLKSKKRSEEDKQKMRDGHARRKAQLNG